MTIPNFRILQAQSFKKLKINNVSSLTNPYIVSAGQDWFPLDRRHHESTETRRLDSPSVSPCSGVLPHARRPLVVLGGRHEGNILAYT